MIKGVALKSPLKQDAASGRGMGLHRFLVFLSLATLFLIVAGALVTSNDAGLSVPDWPTSFGSFRMPPMVGGVMYEHGHRMIAASVGLLTVILTVWVLWKEHRRWIRRLGVIALLAVIVQGAFGGITVRYFLPPPVSTLHACLAQLFFALIVSLAVFTAPSWIEARARLEEPAGFSLRSLSVGAVSTTLLQLLLGAAFRHHWFNLIPHMIGAGLVSVLAAWTIVTVFRRYGEEQYLTRPAWVAGVLLVGQLILGPSAYFLLSSSAAAPQPTGPMVEVTVAHVAVGALTLAALLVLTLRVFRVVIPQRRPVDAATLVRST
ncbi:MAG: COX15/CtaA family protein [Acidobacteriia bacterium]|nr:COX15/CtaA family protein [Terriglobia bacterium]